MRTLVLGAALVVVSAFAVSVFAPPEASARTATVCGSVSVAGHKYFVLITRVPCSFAERYARKLIPEKPRGNYTGIEVGKLLGGPSGYTCGASGFPQRLGRCSRGSTGFSWLRAP